MLYLALESFGILGPSFSYHAAKVIKRVCPCPKNFDHKLKMFEISWCVFSLTCLSNLILCSWVNLGAYPRVEHLEGPSLRYIPALLANIKQGWKGFQGETV